MILSIFFLVLVFPTIESCLVVRTPKCECPFLALDPWTIEQYVGNHPFFKNVSYYAYFDPFVTIDDCYISMYCEGYESLVIFDTETAKVFGEYSADGICDRYTQKWLVDDDDGGLATYNRLYGLCVLFSGTPITDPPPTPKPSTCPCYSKTFGQSNAKDYVGHYDFYQDTVSKYELSEAIPSGSIDGCVNFWHCSSDSLKKVLFVSTRAFETIGPDAECYSGTWNIRPLDNLDQWTPYYFITCVNYSAPLPTSRPPTAKMCNCKHNMFTDIANTDHVVQNWNIKAEVSDDKCNWTVTCRGGNAWVRVKYDEDWMLGAKFDAYCDRTSENWLISYDDIEGYDQTSTFGYSCIERESPEPTVTPTSKPSSCPCYSKTFDQSNAKDYVGHYDFYQDTVSKYELSEAIPSGSIDGCINYWHCSSDSLKKVLFVSTRAYETIGPDAYCEQNGYWNIIPGDNLDDYSPFMYITCVNFSAPLPTSQPPTTEMCTCEHRMNNTVEIPSHVLKNWKMKAEFSDDKCDFIITCRDNGLVLIKYENKYMLSSKFDGWCDDSSDENIWYIVPAGGAYITAGSTIEYSCVEPEEDPIKHSTPAPTITPTPKPAVTPTITPTTPKPSTCPCYSKSIGQSNAKDYVGHYDLYQTNVSKYELSEAIPSGYIDGCTTNWHCSSDSFSKVIFVSQTAFETKGLETECYPTIYGYGNWWVRPLENDRDQWTPYLFITCVNFAAPIPTSKPPPAEMCTCKHEMNNDPVTNPNHVLKNWNIKGEFSDDKCDFNMTCRDGGLVRIKYEEKYILSSKFDGWCEDFNEKIWVITSSEGMIYMLVSPFEYSCVDVEEEPINHSTVTPTITPTTPKPSTCPCYSKTIGQSNAKDYVGHYDFYQDTVSKYELSEAIPSGSIDGCIWYYHCSSDSLTKVIFMFDKAFETIGPETECDPTNKGDKQWWVRPLDNWDQYTPYLFITCVNFAAPIPTSKPPTAPMCDCKHDMLHNATTDPNQQLTNWKIEAKVSDDRCEWEVTCRDNGMVRVQALGFQMSEKFWGKCNLETKKWAVTMKLEDGFQTFNGRDTFSYSCIQVV